MKLFVKLALFKLLVVMLYQAEAHRHSDGKGHVLKRVLMQDNYETLLNKVDTLSHKVDVLTAQNYNLTVEFEAMKAKSAFSSQEVAFFAKLTNAISGTGRFVHYDDVVLNIGNAYNRVHGVFVVPVDGTYLFSLYLCSNGGVQATLNLNVNQTIAGTLIADDSKYSECSSRVFILNLKAKDDVLVKTHDSASTDILVESRFGLPSFCGVLLKAH